MDLTNNTCERIKRCRQTGGRRSGRKYSRFAQRLLLFFGEHRTALANQVQRQFADILRSDRTTRMHLQTLAAQGDLQVLRGGMGQPNVYHVTQRGLRACNWRESDKTARRRPNGNHSTHELLITEMATLLTQAIGQRPDLAIPWARRFRLCQYSAFQNLVPDYAFLVVQRAGLMTNLVEVSSGEESPTRIGEKLQAYADWSTSPEATDFLIELYRQHGAATPRPQFRLLLVVENRRSGNDETRLRQVLRECALLDRAMASRIWATSIARLGEAGCVNGPIWARAADLVSGIADWQILATKERRERITDLLTNLGKHRLLPDVEND